MFACPSSQPSSFAVHVLPRRRRHSPLLRRVVYLHPSNADLVATSGLEYVTLLDFLAMMVLSSSRWSVSEMMSARGETHFWLYDNTVYQYISFVISSVQIV